MMIEKIITSKQNELIKKIRNLKKAHFRKKNRLTAIEGWKENLMALKNGWQVEHLVLTRETYNKPEFRKTIGQYRQYIREVDLVTEEIFNSLVYRDERAYCVSVAPIPDQSMDKLQLEENELVLILENVEKPGNIGAIFRSCDAAGVKKIILTESQTELYNPNTIRASLGCIFGLDIYITTNKQALELINEQQAKIITTSPAAPTSLYEISFKNKTALVMGNEAQGVSDFWIKHAHQLLSIPMFGMIDSLNVSVSTAIILYEALRQKLRHGFRI